MKTELTAPIAIVGLSRDPTRYSFKANRAFRQAGFTTLLGVHPSGATVDGTQVVASLDEIPGHIHTLTIYVSAEKQSSMTDAVLRLKPKRIVFNPGAENSVLAKRATDAGIDTIEACTLVLLATGEF